MNFAKIITKLKQLPFTLFTASEFTVNLTSLTPHFDHLPTD